MERVPWTLVPRTPVPLPALPAQNSKVFKIHELTPDGSSSATRWGRRPVCTGPLSHTHWPQASDWPASRGMLPLTCFMPVPGAVCSVSGSTFTGLVLVSVKNPVFLSTEHSVSTWGRDLAQGPQEASSFSYSGPFLHVPPASGFLLSSCERGPDSPLGIPDLGPGGAIFQAPGRGSCHLLPSASLQRPHSTSQSASPPVETQGCPGQVPWGTLGMQGP